jgi:two-component system alkaline phosphatase synthesis response regulator PhoP
MAKKILVVDDERHIVGLIRVNLERAGCEVITAFDGKEALEKVELENPDLVILDAEMPGMDGVEVLQKLRRNSITRELPVIVLTPKRADRLFRKWEGPVEWSMFKPFNPMELMSLVKRILSDEKWSEAIAPPPKPSSHVPVQPPSWWMKVIRRYFS